MRERAGNDRPVILIDLDNTILDFNAAERSALSRALTELGVPFSETVLELYHVLNIRHWEMLEDGLLTRDEVLVKRFEALYRELGIEADAFRTQLLYESNLSEGHWFVPGAEALLETLYGKYRLFICSNGVGSVQDGRIASAGIAPYFEDIFISERIGGNKPERAFFEACFARIPGFDRERALILGDSLTSDIRGGVNAGIRTCWFNPQGRANSGPIFPDREIRSLEEFPPLLERIFG
ncbi:MAG: YjjG family noncanonical pyrimidine nucleotidase [Oscillospiraceae bacterium]|nr:YjjG family noncanonical pyrimidine nucleotidase [Oscillospiraceae bacterium]